MSRSNEILIGGISDVTSALRVIAQQLKMSMTGLVNAGGTENGSLVGIGTGTAKISDMNIGPLLRVLQVVDWEMAGRTRDPQGLMLHSKGAIDLMVTGMDGGRIEVPVGRLEDVPLLLNTVAVANHMTVTGVNKAAGIGGGSLIGIARGTSDQIDLRLGNLVAYVQAGQFELLVRPVHANRRAARVAFAAGHRSP
jgi:hypothetical protein